MARRISELTAATLPLSGTNTLFLITVNNQSFNVSLDQLRANPTFTGTVLVPTPDTSSNNQQAASTSWVRNYSASYVSGLTFPITQGGTGATTASQARTNLQVPSTTDLTNAVSSKLDNGGFLSINNSDRLRVTATGTSPSIDIFKAGGITLYHGNNTSQPVVLTTYQKGVASEFGLSIPLLKCSGGRFDFDPLDDKAEFRVNGLNTQFNIYNSTQDLPYFRVNADRSAQVFSGFTVPGQLNVSSTAPSTSKVTGSAIFGGGIGVAGAINANDLVLTNALPISQGGTGATSASTARTALGLDPTTAQYNASQLRGQNINATTPTTNQMWVYRSGEWQPRSVIQTLSIQQVVNSTTQSIPSSTFTASALTLTITPKSSSSRFKVYLNIAGISKGGSDNWLRAELRRNGTAIATISGTAGYTGSSAINSPGSCSTYILDFPATASAVTYTVFVANSSTGTLTIQSNAETSSLLIEEYEV